MRICAFWGPGAPDTQPRPRIPFRSGLGDAAENNLKILDENFQQANHFDIPTPRLALFFDILKFYSSASISSLCFLKDLKLFVRLGMSHGRTAMYKQTICLLRREKDQ
jgi:hypothetical protein